MCTLLIVERYFDLAWYDRQLSRYQKLQGYLLVALHNSSGCYPGTFKFSRAKHCP